MNDLSFVSSPRISRTQFVRVLERAKSPALPEAERCYAICIAAGLDPAVALAFFGHESSFGKAGLAVQTKNWGNIRRSQGRGTVKVIPNKGPFAFYGSWADSLADWCDLIKRDYVGWRNLPTVTTALRVYAPSSDNNNPDAYAKAVIRDVLAWQAADSERASGESRMRVKRMATRVRSEPNTTSAIVKVLAAGTIVSVVSVTNGERIPETIDDPSTGLNEIGTSSIVWYQVRLSNGKTGYIWSRLLERVE